MATASSARLPATRSTERATTRRPRRPDRAGWGMIAPFFLVYVLFLMWPIVGALWSSLFDSSLGATDGGFRGLDNYGELLSDGDFWSAMWHTLLFTLLSTPPLVLLAMGLAMLVDRALPAQWLFRLAFFAPYVLPVSVVVLLFNWMFQPGYGLLNGTLTWLGFSEVNWLGSEGTAMIAVVLLTVWWTLGFNFVLYIAALQDIPKELYEAAEMDGANRWQQFRNVTLPGLKPVLSFVTMITIIASANMFGQSYLITRGAPGTETRTAIYQIAETGLRNYQMGSAAAMSYVLTVFLILLSLLVFWLFREKQAPKKQKDAPLQAAPMMLRQGRG